MALKIPPSSSSDFSFYRSISLSEPFPSLSHSHQLSHWTCPNTELLMMPCRLLLLCHYNLSPEHPLTDHSMLAAPGEDTEDKLPSCTPCLLPWGRSLRKLKPVTLILMSQKNRERWQKGGEKSTAELTLSMCFFAVNKEPAARIACVQIPPKFPWNFPLQRGYRALVKTAITFLLILVYLLWWRYIC